MNGLIIDTSSPRLALVLIKSGKKFVFVGKEGARRHTPELLEEADKLFQAAEITPKELEAVGAVIGPGSFTGIRIGAATINALSFATGAKVIEITSLEQFAFNEKECAVLLDTKTDGYYTLFRSGGEDEYKVVPYSEAEAISLKKITASGVDPEGLAGVFLEKI